MKKILAFILCLLLCICLLSCEKLAVPTGGQSISSDLPEEKAPSSQNNNENKSPLFSDSTAVKNALAKKAYEAVLKSERTLCLSNASEVYFSDIFYFDRYDTPLQAVIDMDRDGIEEMLFRNSDAEKTVLLHYENDTVYGYTFDRCAMQLIFEDGSFSWSYFSGFGDEYGVSRISFVDGRLKFQELVRTEAYLKFYLNGVEFTAEQYAKYRETITQTAINFTPLDLSLLNEGKALAIASEHWGVKQGEFDAETGYRYRLTVCKDGEHYRVCLYWFVRNSYYEHLKCAWVDVKTGEISAPDYPDAKG